MKTGLSRSRWLPLAALAFFTCTAMARPLLIPPQNLAVPPLPGAPDNPDIVTNYGALGIDQGTLLVAAYRPRDAEGNYESAVHIFERNTQGRWIYAGILTVQPLIGDLRIGGTVAAVSTVRTPDTPSAISVFERGATGWALTGTFPATNSRLVRVEDGSLYLEPQDGCTSPYQEFRKVNGTWTQVATIGGPRCDQTKRTSTMVARSSRTDRWIASTPEPAESLRRRGRRGIPSAAYPRPKRLLFRFGGTEAPSVGTPSTSTAAISTGTREVYGGRRAGCSSQRPRSASDPARERCAATISSCSASSATTSGFTTIPIAPPSGTCCGSTGRTPPAPSSITHA